MAYKDEILAIRNISFNSIRRIAQEFILSLPIQERNDLYESLRRGIELLDTDAQMKCYLFSFGKMHQAKSIGHSHALVLQLIPLMDLMLLTGGVAKD